MRAGTLIRVRRRVAPRATASAGPAMVPAARSRLWLIAAQIVHAPFAAPARGEMGERAVDQVGEGGFDDRVPAVGDVSGGGGFDAVGEERVVPPDREQFVEAGRVRWSV